MASGVRRSKHALLCAQHPASMTISSVEGRYATTLSLITDDGLLLKFWISTNKFVECSNQFSRRKTLVEKSICKHEMSRRTVVIIMASPTIVNQL